MAPPITTNSIRNAAHLPAHHVVHRDHFDTNGAARRFYTRIGLGVGVNEREAVLLLEEDGTLEDVAVEDVILSAGSAGAHDFAAACMARGFHKIYLKFELVKESRKNGTIATEVYGVTAQVLHTPSEFGNFWRSTIGTMVSNYDHKYMQALIGVPRVEVYCLYHEIAYGGSAVELPVPLRAHKLCFASISGAEGTCFRYAVLVPFARAFYKTHKTTHRWLRESYRHSVLERFHRECDYHDGAKLDFSMLDSMLFSGLGVSPHERSHASALTRFEHVNKVSLCIWEWHLVEGAQGEALRARECDTSFPEVCLLLVIAPTRAHYFYCSNAAAFLVPAPAQWAGAKTPVGCPRCGRVFSKREYLDKHLFEGSTSYCRENRTKQREKFRPDSWKVRFTGKEAIHEMVAPIVLYGDFEAVNIDVSRDLASLDDDGEPLETIYSQRAVSYGLCLEATFRHGWRSPTGSAHYVTHTDSPHHEGEASHHFLQTLFGIYFELRRCYFCQKRQHAIDVRITSTQRAAHEAATQCARCAQAFEGDEAEHDEDVRREGGSFKCKHHDHLTGNYISALCGHCNLLLRVPPFCMHVFFHNLNYDLSGILHALATFDLPHNTHQEFAMEAIGAQVNHLKSFTIMARAPGETNKGHKHMWAPAITFKDSQAHKMASLEKCLEAMPRTELVGLRREFGAHFDVRLADGRPLVDGKGIFPYDYFTHVELLDAPLPPREAFASALRGGSGPTDEEWTHFELVRDFLGWTTLRELHDFYLSIDVIGLRDMFEAYRRVGRTHYGIDPAYYLTSPSYAWSAMLRNGHFHPPEGDGSLQLSPLYDGDMFAWLERGKRGGVSVACHRYAESNHPWDDALEKGYDPTKPRSDLVYLDANNLYGWAMTRALPVDGYAWVEEHEHALARNATIDYGPTEGSREGYFFEVALDYPQALHDLHADLPLAPVKRAVTSAELTDAAREVWLQERGPKERLHLEQVKLLTTLEPKERYVLWGSTLAFYQRMGLVVTHIYRVLRCTMKPFMEPFITKNTALRTAASAMGNDADKDFFKLLNNSVFGKTMENVRDRTKLAVLKTDEGERFTSITKHPTFRRTLFDVEGISILESAAPSVTLDKPIGVGVAVLDLSKEHMYGLWYDHIKKHYGARARLLFTDTDSLCFQVRDGDWYNDCLREPLLASVMDFSGYPSSYPNPNKAKLGYLKDECAPGRLIYSWSFRAKMHAELMTRGSFNSDTLDRLEQKVKGLRKDVAKSNLKKRDWDAIVQKPEGWLNKRVKFTEMRTSRVSGSFFGESEALRKHIASARKRTLSFYDDKRALLGPDYVSTLPYGHYALIS